MGNTLAQHPVKILLISDRISPTLYDHYHPGTVYGVDMVISCGDLPGHYLDYIISMLNVPCYYVPGNHDTGYVKQPPPGWTSLDGKIVVHKDIFIAGLGGSQRYKEGPYQYSEFEMRNRWLKMQPAFWRHKKKLDILVTHSPASGLGDLDTSVHRGFKIFRHIIDKYKPRYHFHGHVHLNYSIHPRVIEHNETRIVNGFQHHIVDFR